MLAIHSDSQRFHQLTYFYDFTGHVLRICVNFSLVADCLNFFGSSCSLSSKYNRCFSFVKEILNVEG